MSVDDGSDASQTEASRWFDTLDWKHDYDGYQQLVAPKGVPDGVEMRLYDTEGNLKDPHAAPGSDYFPALLGSFPSWFIAKGEVLVLEYQGEQFRVVGSDW